MKRARSFPVFEVSVSPRHRGLSEEERALWESVAKQVKPLKELLDLRTKLSDLRGALQGNDKLDELLMDAAGNTEKLSKLKSELGQGKGESND